MMSASSTEGGTVRLTPEQQAVHDEILRWFEDPGAPQVLRLFGPAGTGKTTLVGHVRQSLAEADILFGAYSGKAAHVLRTKGCEGAATLHSLCQVRTGNPAKAERDMLLDELAHDDLIRSRLADPTYERTPVDPLPLSGDQRGRMQARIAELERPARRMVFARSEESPIADADLLICDEVSMVSEKLGKDLLSYDTKILVVGDPHQLPPIEGGGFFTAPAARFETLHLSQVLRQEMDSDVIRYATWVREVRPGDVLARAFYLEAAAPMRIEDVEGAQVLVAFNDTRWRLIEAIRADQGREPGMPEEGDQVICLTNNRDLGVFNGQTFTVENALLGRDGLFELDLVDDLGEQWSVQTFPEAFSSLAGEKALKARGVGWRDEIALMTFAQAMTVHKAQGSEWDSVALVVEPARQVRVGWNLQPWLYTGLTRAAKTVTTWPRFVEG
jgi:exodeoxyribonuclease V